MNEMPPHTHPSVAISPDSVEVRLRYHPAGGTSFGTDFVIPSEVLRQAPADIAFDVASLSLAFCRAVVEARRA